MSDWAVQCQCYNIKVASRIARLFRYCHLETVIQHLSFFLEDWLFLCNHDSQQLIFEALYRLGDLNSNTLIRINDIEMGMASPTAHFKFKETISFPIIKKRPRRSSL